MSKYHAKKVTENGITFASKSEYQRWQELELLQRAGEITDLRRAKTYPLIDTFKRDGKTYRGVKYTPDFEYVEAGQVIVEELKSRGTKGARDYGLRVKLFLTRYPDVTFREVVV